MDSAIEEAVDAGDLKAVKALLNRGANPNASPNKGRVTLLHSAAYRGHKDMVELLIAKGADVNAKCINDITPLYQVAGAGGDVSKETQGHLDVVELLIAKGADIDARNDYGWTPLYAATYYGRRRTAEVLRQHGGHE